MRWSCPSPRVSRALWERASLGRVPVLSGLIFRALLAELSVCGGCMPGHAWSGIPQLEGEQDHILGCHLIWLCCINTLARICFWMPRPLLFSWPPKKEGKKKAAAQNQDSVIGSLGFQTAVVLGFPPWRSRKFFFLSLLVRYLAESELKKILIFRRTAYPNTVY